MTALQAESIAAEKLAALSMAELLTQWELTDNMPIDSAVAAVRGWILAAMERKQPQEFENWMLAPGGANPRDFFKI